MLVLYYFKKLKKLFYFNNKNVNFILNIIKQKWYFDNLYNFLFVKKLSIFSLYLWKTIDKKIIDGLGPIGFSSSIYLASKYIKQIQSGKIFNYATFMILGIVLFFILIFINL